MCRCPFPTSITIPPQAPPGTVNMSRGKVCLCLSKTQFYEFYFFTLSEKFVDKEEKSIFFKEKFGLV